MAATETVQMDTPWHHTTPGTSRARRPRVVAQVLIAVLASIAAASGTAIAAEAPKSSAAAEVPRSSTARDAPPGAPANHGDAAKGAARAEALFCSGCHGPGGRSVMPEYPSLAAQVATYLQQQLRLFRSGERVSQEMAPITATLGDDDIADLSAYYAAQSTRPPASPPQDTPPSGDLYRNGDAARSIQPCAACHGPEARGDGATMAPALRSMQAPYIRTQLEAYARRTRYQSAVPDGLPRAGVEAMYDVSAHLTDDEVRALAQYLQSLP